MLNTLDICLIKYYFIETVTKAKGQK